MTQEARKARTTAELGHGGASRSLDLTCHSVEPPHWEAAGGKGPARQGAGAPQLLLHVALTEAGDVLPYLVATQPCVSAVIGPPSPAAWDSPALLFLSGLGPTPVGGRDP